MVLPNEREMRLLNAIGGSERSGRDVAARFAEQSHENPEFRKTISYGALYVTLARMKEKGWVDSRDDTDEDGRVRFFHLSGLGERVRANGVENFGLLAVFGRADVAGMEGGLA